MWVQHAGKHLKPGSEPWQIVNELVPGEDESRVEKAYGDAFEQTPLESILAELGVGSLLVTGAQTDQCIRCTLHGGLVRGYDVTLISDAHTTDDNTGYGAPPPDAVIDHTNLYWTYETAPGRSAGTLPTAEVDLGGAV